MSILKRKTTITLEKKAEIESSPMTRSQDIWIQSNACSLLNAVTDAVIAIDSHGRICYVNSATTSMFGFDADELIHQPVSMMMPEPYRTEHQSYIERYLSDGKARVLGSRRQLFAQAKDGRQFPIVLEINEIGDAEDACFVGIVRDLSEYSARENPLIAQQERFSQINRLSTLGEMTANIAHEINQPLAAISLYAQISRRLLDRSEIDKSKLADALEKLIVQTLRAGEVIERIQNFMRPNSGERQRASINQIVEEVHPLMAANVSASGIQLEFMKSKTSPIIFCNPLQIQQVLINLVQNAADAMLEVNCRYGRVISINCDDSAPGVVVSVVDCGSGIDNTIRTVIFDAFQTSKPAGTGMGLSVSRSIIEQHEGSLSCRNNSGWGATFSFRLPLVSSSDPS